MASKQGASVPSTALKRARSYVTDYLKEADKDLPMNLTVQAFILDVLAQTGAPDAAGMNWLYERRDRLPVFGRALLAHAMAVGKGDEQARKDLIRDLRNHIRISSNTATVVTRASFASLMDSKDRTTAMVLRALLADDPHTPLAARLVRGLLERRKGGTWRTTQETAFVLLALDDYRKAQEKQSPNYQARVWLGDDQLLDVPVRSRTTKAFVVSLPTSRVKKQGGNTLTFQATGKGILFYETRLTYARVEPRTTPLDRGLFVTKAMRVVTPDSIEAALRSFPKRGGGVRRARGGELVLVDLAVVSPRPLDYVVVDDPIPAGLEPIDSSMANVASYLGVDDDSSEDDSSDAYVRQLHDDRVTFFVDHMAAGLYHYRYLTRATTVGRFAMPATRAEAMYRPEVFGRTGDGGFEVRP
jgi:uncharacterized protein YfaS (alpha-2-macroglobulin family)